MRGALAAVAAVEPIGTSARSLLNVRDVADELGCGERLVRNLIAEGKLPGIRLGRLVKVRRVDLDRFLAG